MHDNATPEHSADHSSEHSRRGFLKSASTTAAVAGAGIAGASLLTSTGASAATPRPATVPDQANEPLVAYVRDARSGEIAVLVGEREVVVHDKDLAARIARAAY